MIIKSDRFGFYVEAGGWKSRPLCPTRFKEGEKVKTHHYGGTVLAGVGKDESCKRGKYLEMWITTGMTLKDVDRLEGYCFAWYKREALMRYGHCHFKGVSLSKTEEKRASVYFKLLKENGEK